MGLRQWAWKKILSTEPLCSPALLLHHQDLAQTLVGTCTHTVSVTNESEWISQVHLCPAFLCEK
jgi:hypothetical protein